MTRVLGADGAKQAGWKLWRAIRLYPQTLLSKTAQRLIIKLLLIRILTPRIATTLLCFIGQTRANRILNSADEKTSMASIS